MERDFEKLEQIMKPYFDKKYEIERELGSAKREQDNLNNKISKIRDNREQEKRQLELRLEKLIDNKNKEISEYIEQIYLSNPNVSPIYVSMVKKDLEQAYKNQEDSLNSKIAELGNETEEEINSLEAINKLDNTPNYDRVYEKELQNISEDLRKQLLSYQKEISEKLSQEKINFDNIMLQLSKFKYEYNEQHQVINGNVWRELYDKSNTTLENINSLKKVLNATEDYLSLTDSKNYKYISLAPWEQSEYDRRNSKKEEEIIKVDEQPLMLEESNKELTKTDDSLELSLDDLKKEAEVAVNKVLDNDKEKIEDPVISTSVHINDQVISDDYSELVKQIYNDVIEEAESLRSISLNSSKGKLLPSERHLSVKNSKNDTFKTTTSVDLGYKEDEEIQLPNGEYVNKNDFVDALNKYYNKNKGKEYVVQEISENLEINRENISKFKKALKNCSIIKLIKDKALSALDLKRVYGKEKTEEYVSEAKQIGAFSTDLPEGEYVSRNELIAKMKKLFSEKKISWLKKVSEKLKATSEPVDAIDESEIEIVDEEKHHLK